MLLLAQAITSFFASAAFGVLFNVPKNRLVQCGAVGMVGWLIYTIGKSLQVDVIPATCVAAFIVSIISQLFAKQYRAPIIVFSVAGIIPLVPGGLAYDAMKHVVLDQYNDAMQLGLEAFMLSGAIAFGLVLSEVINQLIRISAQKREEA